MRTRILRRAQDLNKKHFTTFQVAYESVWKYVGGTLTPSRRSRGVLRIKILQATGLKIADFTLNGGSSDPYVRVSVGGQSRRTPTIPTTLDPVWHKFNTFYFPVFDDGQLVEIEVLDEDALTADDLLGMTQISVRQLIDQHKLLPKEQTFELDKGCGTLTLVVEWLDALGDGELINSNGCASRLVRTGGHDERQHMHYCGRVVGKECYYSDPYGCCTTPDKCDGVCGYDGTGCQCSACHSLDQPMHQLRPQAPMDYFIDSMSDVHHVEVASR